MPKAIWRPLRHLTEPGDKAAPLIVNLGTEGTVYSVLEMLNTFKSSISKTIPYTITNRRPG